MFDRFESHPAININHSEFMMKKEDNEVPFSIPVSSLSKKEARNEFRRAVKEHGNTEPHKIEERRIIVSERMIIIQKQIETLQLNKKAMIADHDKKIQELVKTFEQTKDSIKNPIISQQIEEIEQSKFAQINHYDTIIASQMSNQNIAELLCLVVDSETLRDEVVSKGGKKGLVGEEFQPAHPLAVVQRVLPLEH